MIRYQLQRRPKPGPVSDIENEAFRSECISYAALGLSRRGVAARVGKPESTLRGWIERGMAFPNEEPWGSFSVQYRRAERGLEAAGAGTIAFTVGRLWRLCQVVERGERPDADPGDRELAINASQALADNAQLKELLNVLAARFPEDWGTSKHRKPEPEFDAQNYLDAHAMEREQLAALFADPPEVIRLALTDAGWSPARKVEDETTKTERADDP